MKPLNCLRRVRRAVLSAMLVVTVVVLATTIVTMITPPAAQAMALGPVACSVAAELDWGSRGWNWLCAVAIYIDSLGDLPGDAP